jgi:hypothetical protein
MAPSARFFDAVNGGTDADYLFFFFFSIFFLALFLVLDFRVFLFCYFLFLTSGMSRATQVIRIF